MDGKNFLSFLLKIVSSFLNDSYLLHVLSISDYGIISRKSSVLIIGGLCDGSPSSLIAKYTIDKWEHVGNLQKSRSRHRAIANEDRIYVVGGWGQM